MPEQLEIPYNQPETANLSPFSIIAPFYSELQEAANFVFADTGGPYTEFTHEKILEAQNNPGVQRIPWNNQTNAFERRLITVYAGYLADQPETEYEFEMVEAEVKTRLAGLDDESPLIPLIAYKTLSVVEMVRNLRQFCGDICSKINIDDRPIGEQYELMKLLAIPITNSKSSGEKMLSTLQTLYAYNQLNGHQMSGQLQFIEKLKAGLFDELIAQDLIRQIINSQPHELNAEELIIYDRVIRPANRFNVVDQEDMIAILGSNLSLQNTWPVTAKTIFDKIKRDYSDKLETNYKGDKEFFNHFSVLVPRSNLEDVDNEFDRFSNNVIKQINVNARKAQVHLSKMKHLPQKSPKHPVSTSTHTVAELSQIARSAVVEAEAEPTIKRAIKYIKPSGEIVDEGDPSFDKLFEDFIQSEDNSEALRQDLENIKLYLKTVSFTPGLPKVGITKMKDAKYSASRKGQSEQNKRYHFKPRSAPNCPTTSENGNDIRVIFNFLPDRSIGIRRLTMRDDLSEVLGREGVRGRSRRK